MSQLNVYLKEAYDYLQEAHSEGYAAYNSIAKIKALFSEGEKNLSSQRKLKVAIAGKMNTGKSMLVDNLFFQGQGIVTSCETPSTARLSTINYSEKRYAEVTFIDEKDIHLLKEMAKKFEEEKDEEYEAAYELYTAIQESEFTLEDIKKLQRKVPVNELKEYSDADGKYTVFVKSIEVYENQPILKELEIIDTPGLGDPVISREKITSEKMREVDVVIYLSYAGMFMDDNDIKYYLFLKKMGIANVIVLASRFDEVLEKKDFYGEDLGASEKFMELKEDFIERLKEYEENPLWIPAHIYPSMPLVAKVRYACLGNIPMNDTLQFYKDRYELKYGLNLKEESCLRVSGIKAISEELHHIAEEKDKWIFESNKNSILACIQSVEEIYNAKRKEWMLEQSNLEMVLDNPKLLERIKKETDSFGGEFSKVLLKVKLEAIQKSIFPRCQRLKETLKLHITNLRSNIENSGFVSREIRNATDILSTNIVNFMNHSLKGTLDIGNDYILYKEIVNSLEEDLKDIKFKDSKLMVESKLGSFISSLKENLVIFYKDYLNSMMGPQILAAISPDAIIQSILAFSEKISTTAIDFKKVKGFGKEKKRNHNSEVLSTISNEINSLHRDIISRIDRLENEEINIIFDQINKKIEGYLEGKLGELFAEYSDLELDVIHEKLDKLNSKIQHLEGHIESITELEQKVSSLQLEVN